MSLFGNLIWLLFGGIIIAIEYVIASILLMITIIGIPFGLQTLKLGMLALWPFGQTAISRPASSGCLSTLITIIGLPFGMQHFKLAGLALTPFGKEIVSSR